MSLNSSWFKVPGCLINFTYKFLKSHWEAECGHHLGSPAIFCLLANLKLCKIVDF